ncbi:MAG: DNA alkylation repair protein [Nanoarchaeota archaeon]
MTIILKIRKKYDELSQIPENIKDYSKFHKDGKSHIGLSTAVTKKLAAEYFKRIKDLGKDKVLTLCEELLDSDSSKYQEITFDWAFRLRKQYKENDFLVFEKWLKKYVQSWSGCDDLCTHALGYFLWQFPCYTPNVYAWAKSKNKWERRASAVILIYSARRGRCLNDCLRIAEILLLDNEDLVQKGYGWMLKEASKCHQKEILGFVMKNKKVMPRTALRYAVEKMPEKLRKQARA